MILFVRRSRRDEPDPYVTLKMVLFVLGAAVALAGMIFTLTWLVVAAMVILGVAFAVRFLPRRGEQDDGKPPD